MDESNKNISQQEALNLLTKLQEFSEGNKVFDEFGNYVFPTDIIVERPNVAVGSYIVKKT